jgi:Leucine-rich repeat (LRR) protein
MIEFIEVGAFSCLPKLRKLDLDGNKLKHCPLLNELNSLERLSLNGNQIESIDGLFENMADLSINTKLRVLILNSNWLASLPAKAFSRLASLVTLDLNNNDLAVVSKDAFKGLFNLRALILSDIRSDAEFRIFDPELENLEVIDLRNSRFGIIKEKSKSWSFRNQVIVNAGELSDNPFVQNLAQANHIQIYPSYLKFDE